MSTNCTLDRSAGARLYVCLCEESDIYSTVIEDVAISKYSDTFVQYFLTPCPQAL